MTRLPRAPRRPIRPASARKRSSTCVLPWLVGLVSVLPQSCLAQTTTTTVTTGLDRGDFWRSVATFGAPTAAFTWLSFLVLRQVDFQLSQLAAVGLYRGWKWLGLSGHIETFMPFVTAALACLVATPVLLMLVWGLTAYQLVNNLFGLSIVFVGVAFLLTAYGVLRWRSSAWRITWTTKLAFAGATVLVFVFQVWVSFMVSPFTYLGVSAVFLVWNMMPMVHLTYLLTDRVTIKPFREYSCVSLHDPEARQRAEAIGARENMNNHVRRVMSTQSVQLANSRRAAGDRNRSKQNERKHRALKSSLSVATAMSANPTFTVQVTSASNDNNDVSVSNDKDSNNLNTSEHSKPTEAALSIELRQVESQVQLASTQSLTQESARAGAGAGAGAAGAAGDDNNKGSSNNTQRKYAKRQHKHARPIPSLDDGASVDHRYPLMLYMIAVLILAAYALVVLFFGDDVDDGGNGVGFITAGAVIVLDFTIFLCVVGNKLRDPFRINVFLVLGRFAVMAFGDRYWFLGHTLMFVILGTVFGKSIIDTSVPPVTKKDKMAVLSRSLQELAAQNDREERHAAGGGGASPTGGRGDEDERKRQQRQQQQKKTKLVVGDDEAKNSSKSNADSGGGDSAREWSFVRTNSREQLEQADAAATPKQSPRSRSRSRSRSRVHANNNSNNNDNNKKGNNNNSNSNKTIPMPLQHRHRSKTVSALTAKFHRTRVGRVVSSRVDAWAFLMLTVCFCGDMYINYKHSDFDLHFEQTHRQYLAGIVGMLVLASLLGALLVYRVYQNNEFRINAAVLCGCLTLAVFVAACGYVLHWLTDSVIILSLCIYMPLVVCMATWCYRQWIDNDYHVLTPSRHRNPPFARFCPTFLKLGFPPQDYAMLLFLTVMPLAVVSMGYTMARSTERAWIAWAIVTFLIVLPTSILPIVEWFNTFEISFTMKLLSAIGSLTLFAFCALMYLLQLKQRNTGAALGLLFVFFVYPTLTIMGAALYKWRDDKKMTKFVRWALTVCVGMLYVMLTLVTLTLRPWQVGATALFMLTVALSIRSAMPWLRSRMPRVAAHVPHIVCALVMVYATAVALEEDRGFVGFSLGWGVLFTMVAYVAVKQHRESAAQGSKWLFSDNIFPVYEYRPSAGVHDPLVLNNSRAWYVFLLSLMSFVWGVTATYFIERRWIGLGAQALGILSAYMYATRVMRQSDIDFASAVNYLKEGSREYRDTVAKCMFKALTTQLSFEKAVNTNGIVFDWDDDADDNGTGMSAAAANGSDARRGQRASDKYVVEASKSGKRDVHKRQRSGSLTGMINKTRIAPPPLLSGDGDEDGGVNNDDDGVTSGDQARHDVDIDLESGGSGLSSRRRSRRRSSVRRRRSSTNGLVHSSQFVTQADLAEIQADELEALVGDMLQLDRSERLEDWMDVRERCRQFRKAMPPFQYGRTWRHALCTGCCCCCCCCARQSSLPRSVDMIWAGMRLHRFEALYVLLKLQRRLDQLFFVQNKYQVHMQFEVISAVETIKYNHERMLLNMLRNTGRGTDITLKDIHNIENGSELRDELNRQYLVHKRKQDVVQRLRAIRRAQDHEAQRLRAERVAQIQREEQERVRALEQQLEQQQHQHGRLDVGSGASTQHSVTGASPRHHDDERKDSHGVVPSAHGSPTDEERKVQLGAQNGLPSSSPQLKKQVSGGPLHGSATLTTIDLLQQQRELPPEVDPVQLESRLKRLCEERREQFTDVTFPASERALFMDPSHPKHAEWREFQWRRISEFAPESRRLFVDPLCADDIRQGRIGNCWFMSALAVLTNSEKRQGLLKDIFVTQEPNEFGFYVVRLWKDGKQHTVVVDDLLPCRKTRGRGVTKPAFARSKKANELWVMLLEKAYAKMHGGTYEGIEGGYVDQALVDLTGGIASRIDMSKPSTQQEIRTGGLFATLLDYHESGYLMGAGSPAGEDSVAASRFGIVQGHAYSLLRVVEVDGLQLVQLRNPWGRQEWTGDYSDNSPQWTRRLKAKLGYTQADDGVFWMSFQDFVSHFEDIYVCRFFADSMWIAREVRSKWSVADNTAGGCTNFPTVVNNPQFAMRIVHPSTKVVLHLIQEDVRGSLEKSLVGIGIEVYENEGQRVSQRRTGRLVCSNVEGYIFRREVTCQVELAPSEVPYTVLVSTFSPNQERSFVLKTFSTKQIDFERI